MASVWVEGVAVSLGHALDMLAAAVRDCPDGLWETAMWPVPVPGPDHQFLGPDWQPVTNPARRNALARLWVERRSTPWSVAWHALEVVDYDLNGDFSPWQAPPPFQGHPHWRDLPILPKAWSRADVLGYVDYCRGRVRDTLSRMTEASASRPLPPSHRYGGQPHALVIVGLINHTTEHAAQLRQFLTGAGM